MIRITSSCTTEGEGTFASPDMMGWPWASSAGRVSCRTNLISFGSPYSSTTYGLCHLSCCFPSWGHVLGIPTLPCSRSFGFSSSFLKPEWKYWDSLSLLPWKCLMSASIAKVLLLYSAALFPFPMHGSRTEAIQGFGFLSVNAFW